MENQIDLVDWSHSYDDTLAKETRPFYVCTDCR